MKVLGRDGTWKDPQPSHHCPPHRFTSRRSTSGQAWVVYCCWCGKRYPSVTNPDE